MISALLLFINSSVHHAKRDDPLPLQERTVFQTGSTYKDRIDIGADVAIVYGIDKTMPERVKAWRAKGYHIHLMTGVAWGEYQDYYYGRWDGINHEGEAQTRSNGEKVGHGGDVYYMSPGKDYGKFLAVGVRHALEAGVEAVHLEEPEFWTFGGYGQGFKDEWKAFYNEKWQDPASSPDARWRAAKLMYFLYRRALQQVFDSIQDWNKAHSAHVRCYVPTHSLLNYAHWNIVSPESSLARLNGCDGYIAQVWTGTARTPNIYRGVKKERTFETAFLEYGAMQNLVRSTGRGVWYLADPIEDNPDHDWGDYRRNYQSTLVASLLQPEVSQYEVMPWPERIFNGAYPSETDPKIHVPIPATYATELQVVINSLKDMKQKAIHWETGASSIGVLVSDSLMFQRGGPDASDGDMGHVYGLAMPFVKRGIPVQPIQLENVTLPHYLDGFKLILMTYEGMKPLTPEVHEAIAHWVKSGGNLVFVDADSDPFLKVREWWNSDGKKYTTPREHLFERMGITFSDSREYSSVGHGSVVFLKRNPTEISHDPKGDVWLTDRIHQCLPGINWTEKSALILRRGPYVIAAGLSETDLPSITLSGQFVDLFDPELKVVDHVDMSPESRHFLVDLRRYRATVVAAGGRVNQTRDDSGGWEGPIEGIANTPCVMLLRAGSKPTQVLISGKALPDQTYDPVHHLLWLRFPNLPNPQKVQIQY